MKRKTTPPKRHKAKCKYSTLGEAIFATRPDPDTLTLGSVTFTFRKKPRGPLDVAIVPARKTGRGYERKAARKATVANLVAAINATGTAAATLEPFGTVKITPAQPGTAGTSLPKKRTRKK